jgi:hypothetical protein
MLGSRYEQKPLKHGAKDTCTCPHCWTVFPFEDALYVARHPELLGDPMLGQYVASRFKPTRFTAQGQAIDPGGYACLEMACPACHLEVPKSLSEFPSLFFSIVGTEQSGKSFFLAALSWQLRKLMRSHFAMALSDLETSLNKQLNTYEDVLFFAKDPDQYVTIDKTQQTGPLYNSLTLNGVDTFLPRPFLFTIKPQLNHPEIARGKEISRTLVLYDNAGEHFNPDQDTLKQPGTMHMVRSEVLFFMFDPTQDPRFRAKLAGNKDPQLQPDWHIRRQDIIFNEAARRIRRHSGMSDAAKYRKTVIVVVNKFDLWKHLLPIDVDPSPFMPLRKGTVHGLETGYVEDISFIVQSLLNSICPEVVTAVEQFAQRVIFIPVSTIGHSPIRLEGLPGLRVRPRDIKPFWVTIPFLYAFARLGLIYRCEQTYPADLPHAKLIGIVNGLIHCIAPDGTRLEVPPRLAGKVIHHPKSGVLFIVPTATTTNAPP